MATNNAYHIKAGEKLITKTGEPTHWTALENSFVKSGKTYCKVQCDCSNIFTVRIAAIKNGLSMFCQRCSGIHRRDAPRVGDSIGSWTILQVSYPKNRCTVKVKCRCGKISWIAYHQMKFRLRMRRQTGECRDCMGRRREKLGLGLLVVWRNQWFPKMPWMTQGQAAHIAKQNCFYCGCVPSNTYRRNYKTKRFIESDWNYQGIDAVDYSLGHIQGNILPCCFLCNRAKNNESLETFCDWWNRRRNIEHGFTPEKLIAKAKEFGNMLSKIQ